ncbi:LytTR family transcriptional regulator DNA-binding domain-containing protein [Achromobacter mucicolens]|uniref:GAF domain-containing DNA-binding protein n=1 Tax=Achromobacter mucicolens TaxID=1389922 RepID=UPI0020A5EDEA|nr:LytTR family transcriptional regulator DNA-binding domain-containing protein [Achromobacter mucicolens]MCP2514873.1 LytTR family transcriptional regulator DNA-binding domain-containing protein [Achromobacter mucicolens]WGJ89745.1 LytTR family transcriptional regulator DNA-binding domain-containing protein [Achromobacter mucicolens]
MKDDVGQYQTHPVTLLQPDPSSQWVYHCAMSLLKLPADDAISEQLAYMGETSDIDRSWMIEYRPDMLRLRNTHEWCRGQTAPFVAELQDVPTTLIAWLHRFMVKGQAVAIHDVNDLPRTARTIQAEFQRQGNKSVLSVPVCHDGKLQGIIGFDTTLRHRHWSAAEVGALYQCANLIGQAKYGSGRTRAPLGNPAASVVYLSMRGVVRGVQPEAIVGVRSAGNYSEIWLEDGSMVLDSRALGVWSTLLPEQTFFRVHRTAIANALHVMDVDRRSVDKWQIRMRAVDDTWPVSRAYRKPLRERMGL